MRMEGSPENGWQRSGSPRGFKSSGVSDKNPLFYNKNNDDDGDDDDDSGDVRGREIVGLLSRGGDDDASVVGKECNDVSLRQWLDNPERAVVALECLHMFRQIVEIVNTAHSRGIVVHNVRPSCFVLTSFNRVSFIESASCSDSGSDTYEDESNCQTVDEGGCSLLAEDVNRRNVSQMVSGTRCLQSGSENVVQMSVGASHDDGQTEEKKHPFPMKHVLRMETNWYTSPEEFAGAPAACASDIYRLGVLLFELYCTFSSAEEKSSTMCSLRHRVLPPQLLLKWPKEASFCLWLLHPEPTNRPKMGELLQSEFLNDPRDKLEEREIATQLKERMEEQYLLLEFLLLIQQKKQEAAENLCSKVSFISSDIEEVTKLQTNLQGKGGSSSDHWEPAVGPLLIDNDDSCWSESRKRFRHRVQNHSAEESDGHHAEHQKSEAIIGNQERIMSRSSRLMRNFKKLESAYYLTRRRAVKGRSISRNSLTSSDDRGSIVVNERSYINSLPSKERFGEGRTNGWINSFLEGLCKYLSFTKLNVTADLKQGDLLNSSNLVCSLSFDRDGEFFATAGVNKKIKVFEYDTILNEDRDIHYPVVEMSSLSKLSSVCWNGYIKSQIASSNFEGVVQVWDITRSQVFMEMKEHERRVWSVDFSVADPTMLASGSDDGSVKLWNINQGVSVGTIKTKANVCCVQFPSDSGNSLAFSSADHKIYYYDLRNLSMPLFTLMGHNKTVSHIKFIDSVNLVSASTDNSLKLWDLSMCTSRVLECPLQSFTGHLNVKNFVGLSVADGYIATGSETNEVFVYHKAFPMPAFSFKFNSIDPLSGAEVDDTAQFISSVCWRGQSSSLVAANSMGNIKLLEMV